MTEINCELIKQTFKKVKQLTARALDRAEQALENHDLPQAAEEIYDLSANLFASGLLLTMGAQKHEEDETNAQAPEDIDAARN